MIKSSLKNICYGGTGRFQIKHFITSADCSVSKYKGSLKQRDTEIRA